MFFIVILHSDYVAFYRLCKWFHFFPFCIYSRAIMALYKFLLINWPCGYNEILSYDVVLPFCYLLEDTLLLWIGTETWLIYWRTASFKLSTATFNSRGWLFQLRDFWYSFGYNWRKDEIFKKRPYERSKRKSNKHYKSKKETSRKHSYKLG